MRRVYSAKKQTCPLSALRQNSRKDESGFGNAGMKAMRPENLADIIADAHDKCVPGSVGIQNLTGCHRHRLLSRATAAINAIQEAGYVIAPREQALNGNGDDPDRPQAKLDHHIGV